MLRNEKGFTLIEIIAVLVILGILAAVAVPRYFSMVDRAQQSAVMGAVAALQSTATSEYASQLIVGPGSTYTPASASVVVGVFTGSIVNANGAVTVRVTAVPTGYASSNWAGTYGSKSFRLYN